MADSFCLMIAVVFEMACSSSEFQVVVVVGCSSTPTNDTRCTPSNSRLTIEQSAEPASYLILRAGSWPLPVS